MELPPGFEADGGKEAAQRDSSLRFLSRPDERGLAADLAFLAEAGLLGTAGLATSFTNENSDAFIIFVTKLNAAVLKSAPISVSVRSRGVHFSASKPASAAAAGDANP